MESPDLRSTIQRKALTVSWTFTLVDSLANHICTDQSPTPDYTRVQPLKFAGVKISWLSTKRQLEIPKLPITFQKRLLEHWPSASNFLVRKGPLRESIYWGRNSLTLTYFKGCTRVCTTPSPVYLGRATLEELKLNEKLTFERVCNTLDSTVCNFQKFLRLWKFIASILAFKPTLPTLKYLGNYSSAIMDAC